MLGKRGSKTRYEEDAYALNASKRSFSSVGMPDEGTRNTQPWNDLALSAALRGVRRTDDWCLELRIDCPEEQKRAALRKVSTASSTSNIQIFAYLTIISYSFLLFPIPTGSQCLLNLSHTPYNSSRHPSYLRLISDLFYVSRFDLVKSLSPFPISPFSSYHPQCHHQSSQPISPTTSPS